MNPNFRNLTLLLICCLFFPAWAIAQQKDLSQTIGSTREDTITNGVMPLDTPVAMKYVLAEDEQTIYSETDTFQWEDLRHQPPGFGQGYLGNLGSATRSLVAGTQEPFGFHTGWFQYDPYFIHESTFRYYHQLVPVAKIKYSQSGQEDTYLSLEFGRSFAKGISLSVQYNRINQLGEFAHQHQKNTGLGIGVWHHAASGKYDAFYNLIANAAAAEENGGITSTALIGDPLYPDLSIPVWITEGLTNHKHRSFMTRQVFHLAPDSASLGIDFWIKARYETGIFKYADPGASKIRSYYGPDFLLEDRGIRQYTYVEEHSESAGLTLPWTRAHSVIDASLRYRHIRLEQEPDNRIIHELYLEASGDFQWIEALKLKGKFSLGLGQADGIYSFEAHGDLMVGPLGHLEGEWSIQSRRPYMTEEKIYVNQLPVYATGLKNPFVNDISVKWILEKQDLQAGVRWLVYDQYIYFDSLAMPVQRPGSFSLRQVSVSKGFDFRWFGLKGKAVWQPDVKPELALPKTMFTASLYGRINLFRKKVTLMPGTDITYYSAFPGITYFPVNGVYHLTGKTDMPEYIRIDAAVGMKINFMKIFLRMEDIQGLLEDRVLYQAALYPYYRGYLRLGLQAGFFN